MQNNSGRRMLSCMIFFIAFDALLKTERDIVPRIVPGKLQDICYCKFGVILWEAKTYSVALNKRLD